MSIPLNFEMLGKSGNLKNLELAASRATSGFIGPVFMDSDVHKALEAASYSLATHPDPVLEKRIDDIVAKLAAAQLPDGYLDSYYIVKEPGRRWTNLRDNHELYCAGHMIEAAVAHFRATGKTNFLSVATKLADHIDSTFGPGKRMGYCGHPEIELALIKLWRATGEKRYFELARFFIENRGRKFFATEHHTPLDRYDGTYWQDDVPICDHRNIKGHAVRAAYLLSGATDVAAETQDPALLKMINRVWRNTTVRNLYITGGIGPSASNEGFTHDYDLPNLTAYQETCASVALAQWNHRLALLYGDARFADVFERSLYNGVLAGVSLDGKRFFYVNPLESQGHHHRSPWFGCACCPPNVARTLASLGGYAYAVGDGALVGEPLHPGDGQHHDQRAEGDPGRHDRLSRGTAGSRSSRMSSKPRSSTSASECRAGARVQRCRSTASRCPGRRSSAGYIVLGREWKDGDAVELNLPMPVQRVAANPNVKDDHGLLGNPARASGLLPGSLRSERLTRLALPAPDAELKAEKRGDLLGGVVVVKGLAETAPEQVWSGNLYQAVPPSTQVPVTAIPYYAWDNRQAGPMKVWITRRPTNSGCRRT